MPTGDSLPSKVLAWALALAGAIGTLLQGFGAIGVKVAESPPSGGQPPGKTASAVMVGASNAAWAATWRTALGTSALGLGIALIVMNSRKDARRRSVAHAVVRVLHQRWFTGNGYTPSAGHRVSLWSPWPHAAKPKEWRCAAVSSSDTKMTSWSHVTSQSLDKLGASGLVAATAYHGVGFYIDGLPDAARSDQPLRKAFRERAFLTESQLESLSWPFASAATRVATRRGGLIECIAMVEREDGLSIEAGVLDARLEDDPCFGELDLAAALWSETMGEQS
jgi:hypothetical protein